MYTYIYLYICIYLNSVVIKTSYEIRAVTASWRRIEQTRSNIPMMRSFRFFFIYLFFFYLSSVVYYCKAPRFCLLKYLPEGSTRHHSTKEKRRASRPSARLKSYLRLNRYLLELLTRYIIISSSRYQLNSRTSYNWSRLACGIYVCVQRTKYYHIGRLKIGSERGVYVLSFAWIAWRRAVSNLNFVGSCSPMCAVWRAALLPADSRAEFRELSNSFDSRAAEVGIVEGSR